MITYIIGFIYLKKCYLLKIHLFNIKVIITIKHLHFLYENVDVNFFFIFDKAIKLSTPRKQFTCNNETGLFDRHLQIDNKYISAFWLHQEINYS